MDKQLVKQSLGFSQESANRRSKKYMSERSKEYCWVPTRLKKCLYKVLTAFTLCAGKGIPVLQPSWAFPSFSTKGTAFNLLPLIAFIVRQCLADTAVLPSLAFLLQEPAVFQGDGTLHLGGSHLSLYFLLSQWCILAVHFLCSCDYSLLLESIGLEREGI